MKTLMVAHRGLSSVETENTKAAFLKAATNIYFEAIECDIHVTKDGFFVVHHDFDTSRLSNKTINIKDSTLDEVLEINLIDIKSNKYDSNNKILLLDEFIEICVKYKKIAVIEIKPEFTVNQINRLNELVKKYNFIDNTIFISFHLKNLIILRDVNQDVKLQLLLDYYTKDLIKICNILNMDLNFRRDFPTKDLILELHNNNIKVNAWTVNKEEDKKELIRNNIDYITTDTLGDFND